MADGVVLDLYADDLDKDFSGAGRDDFGGDGVDLYDDIGGPPEVPPTADVVPAARNETAPSTNNEVNGPPGSNGVYHHNSGNSMNSGSGGRRYQLYVGNLTWWTTDQDIENAIRELGVNDFHDVKFFENRANGQSKGFCVITLGSESSSRLILDRLAKKELHGQLPMVTFPTKQALNQFESMQKTRPVPPPQQNGPPRGPAPAPPMGGPGPMPGHGVGPGMPPGGHQVRMNPNMPPGGQYRPPHMPPQGPPMGGNVGPPRMQSPMHPGGQMPPQQQLQGPPRYPPMNQGQWPNGPRPNGPRQGPPNGPPQRPPMFQGPPGGMQMRPQRPDWNRPPMHGGFPPQGPPGGPPQGPPMMQGPPRGPPGGPQMGPGGPGVPPAGAPSPHVQPGFFNQPGVPPQHPGVPPMGGPPHGPPGPPQQGMNMPPQHGPPPPHFAQQSGPRGPWPPVQQGKPPGGFSDQSMGPQLSETEFEEVMGRNRTVSSSAIARAVSDAAAGEYTSAIETLVTAISLIKQSKVAHDERCKILISSLQDTLHGIEAKSYNRRERSRSRERREHRSRPRRERSSSRYRERSRERERERDHRDREGGYRERSRSRERDRPPPDHYRDDSSSRSGRPRNKSPEPAVDTVSEAPSKRSYYEERSTSRYRERSRDRERDRDRDRREEHRSRH